MLFPPFSHISQNLQADFSFFFFFTAALIIVLSLKSSQFVSNFFYFGGLQNWSIVAR